MRKHGTLLRGKDTLSYSPFFLVGAYDSSAKALSALSQISHCIRDEK